MAWTDGRCSNCGAMLTTGGCPFCARPTLIVTVTGHTEYVDPRDAEIARLKAEGAMLADKAAAAIRERDAALAANAEMRAALTEIIARGQEQRGTGRMIETAEAALSRTDLGRGWASPEVVAQMVGALQVVESDDEFDLLHEVTCKFVVDALLKKGGG